MVLIVVTQPESLALRRLVQAARPGVCEVC